MTSVRASVRLSLTSKHMNGIANRLLTVLGFLPDGLPASGLNAFLGREDRQLTREKSDAATDVLRRLRLLMPRPDGSLRLINPLRECIKLERPLRSPELDRVVSAGLKLLTNAQHFGTEHWPEFTAELRFHANNLVEILTAAAALLPVDRLVKAIEFARRLTTLDARLAPGGFVRLASVLRTRRNLEPAVAVALLAAGDVAMRRDELNGANTFVDEARQIFVRCGYGIGEAHALFALGNLSFRSNDLDEAKTRLEDALTIYVRMRYPRGEATTLRSLGALARRHDDFDRAKTYLEAAHAIYIRIGNDLGGANTLESLGDLMLRCDDLNRARALLEDARAILARIGDNLGEANVLRCLGELALRRDDLEGASRLLDAARAIYVRIGLSLGEANVLNSLGILALRRGDLEGAKSTVESARAISVRIGELLGETNSTFLCGLISTQSDTARAEALFAEARAKYSHLRNGWGTAQCELRLAQLSAAQGDLGGLRSAATQLLEVEARDSAQKAGPGWRAFCASLIETDAQRRAAQREDARAKWTAIGALGLVREMLDFKIELRL